MSDLRYPSFPPPTGASDPDRQGGEGMVVKPVDVVHRGEKGLTQPGIKCRGASTCASFTAPSTRPRPTSPGSGPGFGHKRSLALREFALGIEPLERFVAGEPLYCVHVYVFGVLAPRERAGRPQAVTAPR